MASLEKLQYSIISAITKIRYSVTKQNKHLVIALVSNANTKWINEYLDYNDGEGQNEPKLPILSEYLKQKKIDLLSARKASYNFLKRKLGEKEALKMINYAVAGDGRKNRWILKYLTFGAVISKYKKQLNKSCDRVISFGDGVDEAKAMNAYSKEYKIECIHFDF